MPVVTRRYPYIVTSYPSLPLYHYVMPVVSSQLIVTDSVVTRRYRLHRYRGAVVTRRYAYIVTSLQIVVTGLTGRRYRSRRYRILSLHNRLHPTCPGGWVGT